MVKVRFERVLALPSSAVANTIYFVKPSGAQTLSIYVSGNDGVPIPLAGGTPTPTTTPTPTPTPTPAPAFTTQPSITSDGTPQVGETLTGNDGVITNGTVSGRQWLLAGSPISGATSQSFTPTQIGAHSYRVTATGSGGSSSATSTAATVAAATVTAIGTPTLTKTSAAGTNPIAFTIGIPDNTIVVGYYWHLQVASNAGFTTDLRDETRLITSDDFPADGSSNGNAVFASLANMIDGPTYVRLFVERDDGVSSAPSNVLFDTLASIPANVTFDPATKNSLATLSNNNLTITGNSGANINQSAKSTVAKSFGTGINNKGWVEAVMGTSGSGSAGGNRTFGLSPASVNTTGTNSPIAGFGSTPGLTWHTNGAVYFNGGSVTAGSYGDGDRIGLYYEAGTTSGMGTVWLWKSGTGWIASTGDPGATPRGAGLSISNVDPLFVIAGSYLDNPVTLAFKPADQTGRGTKQAWGS